MNQDKYRILIVDRMHKGIAEALGSLGYAVEYFPDIDREGIKVKIGNYTGIIIRSKTNLDEDILSRGQLRFIARAGAGIDNIDEEYCLKHNIHIINSPEGNRDALGEHAVGMLLTLLNKIHTADREIRKGIWDRENNRGTEIQGKTVGIIGYGNMGSAFAQRLSGFDCRVIAYDKYKWGYSEGNVLESTMDDLYRLTDIISFHVPLTNETRAYYNEIFFNKFKNNIYVINAARGPILPIKDLLKLLNEKKILGAALDVLENEKLNSYTEEEKDIFNDLVSRNNVVLTPHIGGWSFESYKKINDVLVNKIKNLGIII